jgi:hypothetical protein
MKILHLNVEKQWFDMIHYMQKPEEYRKLSDYWYSRFFKYFSIKGDNTFHSHFGIPKGEKWKVIFSNGYAKDRDQTERELKGISIGTGQAKWGAIQARRYFVLKLGAKINP